MVTKTDVIVGALWVLAFLLLLSLVGLRLWGQEFEPGALWHDGNFAPCYSLFVDKAFVTLARDGGGISDPLTWYVLGLGYRYKSVDVLGGVRINLLVEESLTTTYRGKVVSTSAWPLLGVLGVMSEGMSVTKAGLLLTWHGEGWAFWPAFFLGFHFKEG